MSKLTQSVWLGLILVVGFAGGAAWVSMKNRADNGQQTERTFPIQGEVFLQLASGDVARAVGCDAYAINLISQRSRRWLGFLDEAAQKKLSKKLTDKQFVDALRAGILLVYNENMPAEVGGLGKLNSRPAFADIRERFNCDSGGRFEARLKPGSYLVVVAGRAGMNESVWQTTLEVPQAGRVSLSGPIASYFDNP